MAVIIGVVHMTKGIVVKGINCIYFRDYQSFVFEVITGLIILLGLFGWMDVLIFAKWFNPYVAYNFLNPDKESADKQFNLVSQAPSIYNLMINNFLKTGKNEGIDVEGNVAPLYLFDGQRAISETLVVMIIICVPMFLCVKPCIALCCGPEKEHHDSNHHQSEVRAAESENAAEEGLLQKKSVASSNSPLYSDDAYKSDLFTWEKILKAEYGEQGHHGGIGELFIH